MGIQKSSGVFNCSIRVFKKLFRVFKNSLGVFKLVLRTVIKAKLNGGRTSVLQIYLINGCFDLRLDARDILKQQPILGEQLTLTFFAGKMQF